MKNETTNGAVRGDVLAYALDNYGTSPEYLWAKFPQYAVLRRADNKKWYAVVMDVPKDRLGLCGDGRVDILDVKCDSAVRELFSKRHGFLPTYHLSRETWITVLLDGTVDRDVVFGLLDASYEIALGKKSKPVRRSPTSVLVPVNPKYYDTDKAFADSPDDTILWKQSNTVAVGDTIYLYLAAPYSCVKYKCVATEVDIPFEYDDGKVRMKKVMRIKRLHTYPDGMFGLDALKSHGVTTVRGPRGVPHGLCFELEKESGGDA